MMINLFFFLFFFFFFFGLFDEKNKTFEDVILGSRVISKTISNENWSIFTRLLGKIWSISQQLEPNFFPQSCVFLPRNRTCKMCPPLPPFHADFHRGHRVKLEHRKSPGASRRYLENAEHGRQMKTQLCSSESSQSLRNVELWGRSHTTLFA